jgi:hypothetical protein
MKTWTKAFGIACPVEVPPLVALVTLLTNQPHLPSVFGGVLVGYHILSLPFGMSMHIMWVGDRTPPVRGSEVVFWFSVYAAQTVLTTPLIALLLKVIRGRRTSALL